MRATVSYRLPYLPAMLAGGLHFCLLGTVVGLIVFLTMVGVADGRPDLALRVLGDAPVEPLYLAAIFGGPPAFVTGLTAGPLRRAIGSRLGFAAAMAPVGLVATATYLLVLNVVFGGVFEAGLIMLTGGIAALCCAIPFGFWDRAETSRPASGTGTPLTLHQSLRRYLSGVARRHPSK
jgi:hypothetical protein